MARLCPDCHTGLQPQVHFGLTLDVCASCAGLWFDSGEIASLRQARPEAMSVVEDACVPKAMKKPSAGVERWCPVCPRPLERMQFMEHTPIEIDQCPACLGLWVEDGELAKMVEWQRRNRLLPSSGVRSAAEMEARVEMAMAELSLKHEAEMRRIENIGALFTFVCRRRRGWWW